MVSFVMLLATSMKNYPKTESSNVPAVSHYRNERNRNEIRAMQSANLLITQIIWLPINTAINIV